MNEQMQEPIVENQQKNENSFSSIFKIVMIILVMFATFMLLSISKKLDVISESNGQIIDHKIIYYSWDDGHS